MEVVTLDSQVYRNLVEKLETIFQFVKSQGTIPVSYTHLLKKPCRISKSISLSRLVKRRSAGTTADASISPVFRLITVRLILSVGVWSGERSITPIIIHAFPFLSF